MPQCLSYPFGAFLENTTINWSALLMLSDVRSIHRWMLDIHPHTSDQRECKYQRIYI